jgi:energy-coupling factor transporter ATP-binding protein EcfA2
MSKKSIEVENIGPIKKLTVAIPEEGGVVIVSGPNGIGKSTFLDATKAVLGDKAKRSDLRSMDGTEKGKASIGRCRLTVGRSNRCSGELDVLSIEGTADLAEIVDPGIQDPSRADKRRLEAIFALAGEATQGRDIRGELNILEAWAVPDEVWEGSILDVSMKVKTFLHGLARVKEKESVEAASQAEILRGGRVEADLEDLESIEDLDSQLVDANAGVIRLQERMKAAQEARESEEKIRATLAEAEGETLAEIQQRHKQACHDLGLKIAEVERAERERDRLKDEVESIAKELDKAQARENARVKLDELLAQRSQAPGEADLEEARQRVSDLTRRRDTARDIAKVAEDLERARALHDQAAQAERVAREARDLAGDPLEEAVAKFVGQVFPGASVIDGRLMLGSRRGRVAFGQLSHGERWTTVLSLALSFVSEETVLVIPQEAWEGLDGANRKKIDDWARERKTCVLAAQASRDPQAKGIEVMGVK